MCLVPTVVDDAYCDSRNFDERLMAPETIAAVDLSDAAVVVVGDAKKRQSVEDSQKMSDYIEEEALLSTDNSYLYQHSMLLLLSMVVEYYKKW